MQFFYWFVLLVAIGIAIFAVQNAGVSLVTLKFLAWEFKTPMIFMILGSVGVGVLVILFLWVPRAVKNSFKSRELKKKVQNLEKMLYGPSPSLEKEEKPKEP